MYDKQLLTETYGRVLKQTGADARTVPGFTKVLADPEKFIVYARALAEGLSPETREQFYQMARVSRKHLLENSMYNLQPHETLTLPILRNFYPKLIAKELVNVMPIDKPEVVKAFLKPKFRRVVADTTGGGAGAGITYTDYSYEFPSMTTDISRGPRLGSTGVSDAVVFDIGITNCDTTADLLYLMNIDGTTPTHIEKDLTIVGISDDSGSTWTAVKITPTVDGVFSAPVSVLDVSGNVTSTDVISGHVDFDNGIIYLAAILCNVTTVRVTAVASLEENTLNSSVEFNQEKIRFSVIDRRIQGEWSVNLEQDAKALFDINIQSEYINFMGEQIALDIDREIITDLFTMNTTQNPASHTKTFYKIAQATFTHGPKAWYENILVVLNGLSAQIYNDTHMGGANTIAANPLDAAIFEGLNGYEFLGSSTAGGDVGYRSATVSSGKYKLLTSDVVTAGKMIVKYRSNDLTRASYVYAPYVPALIMPYPYGNNPNITIQSRYAKQSIRPAGVGQVNINSDTTSPDMV